MLHPLTSAISARESSRKTQEAANHHSRAGNGKLSRRSTLQAFHAPNEKELKEFKKKIEDHGFSISALSSHGNPLHPDKAVAKVYAETSKRTIELAAKLGIPVVIDFSGCPGDSDHAKYPNWVTCPWPPEYSELLQWQWE